MFFNSTATDRRRHQASDMADYWNSFLSSGLIHQDGVPNLPVRANSEDTTISIDSGKALILGHLYINTEILYKDVELSGASEDRFDRVVLRFDNNIENRYIKVFVKEGTSTEPPELERTFLEGEPLVYELSLAQIHVKAGKSFLEQSDITSEHLDEELCGLASSLVSVPTGVFWDEWQNFVTEYYKWFDDLQETLDENVAGNLYNLITSAIKVHQDVILMIDDWQLNEATGLWEYVYQHLDVRENTIVDVNIHPDSLNDARLLRPATESFNEYVMLYSTGLPNADILCDIKLVRQVI